VLRFTGHRSLLLTPALSRLNDSHAPCPTVPRSAFCPDQSSVEVSSATRSGLNEVACPQTLNATLGPRAARTGSRALVRQRQRERICLMNRALLPVNV
jgi:hypothetical protein